jgi:hypothetical protein
MKGVERVLDIEMLGGRVCVMSCELFLVLAGVYRQICDVVEGLQLGSEIYLPLLHQHSYHSTYRLELNVTK